MPDTIPFSMPFLYPFLYLFYTLWGIGSSRVFDYSNIREARDEERSIKDGLGFISLRKRFLCP
jgi:hypothetical protein